MTPKRLEKFRRVVACRQPDLTVILENVWDPHNVGAVLRTCDSVGVGEIFVLNTEERLVEKQKLTVGKRTSMGTAKWVDVHFYTDAQACFQHVRQRYGLVLGTHLDGAARSLYQLNLTQPVALLFGNEMLGISKEVIKMCDGNFHIPQVGMAQSLNISVACAVSLYEAFRQRSLQGLYAEKNRQTPQERAALLEEYVQRHERKSKPKKTYKAINTFHHRGGRQ